MAHQRIRVENTKGGLMLPDLDYSVCHAVRAGPMVFVGGQTGLTLDGKRFVGESDPAAQADNALKCVKALLEEAGARTEDICKVTTYVTERSYRELVYPVIARHLEGVSPASTGLVVKALALPQMDFEIDVFAVIPNER